MEHFQNPYTILRDREAGMFNYALRLFALILTTLLINTMSAEPLFSKENYYPNYSKENYDTNYSKENYDPKYSKGNYEPKHSYEPARTIIYETEERGHSDQNVESSYANSGYLLSYLYYLWHWIWCNILLIIIIVIIVWLLFRWWYARRITAEFVAAAARLPVAGDLTVGNAQFMLGTLRNSLPV